jgi:hypothetical protein
MKKEQPTRYSSAVADEFCTRIACGAALGALCAEAGMPARRTVYAWLKEQEAFRTQYAFARDLQSDFLADEVLQIADTRLLATKMVTKADGSVETTETDAVDRSRLAVDARKWYVAKAVQKKGDAQNAENTPPEITRIERVIIDSTTT